MLPDGTPSDGKVETYERCVEHVLGSAETFFTSVFSAQGRRQLSAYRNAEIKRLLAHFSDRGHAFQADRGQRFSVIADGREVHEWLRASYLSCPASA